MQNETILSLFLLGFGVYFAVVLTRGLLGYARFRRVRPTAVLTWPVPRSQQLPWLVGLGVVNVALTVQRWQEDRQRGRVSPTRPTADRGGRPSLAEAA